MSVVEKLYFINDSSAGRCEMLGFQECCVANCGSVIPGAPDCFCDQRCIMAGDCCSDVVAIGCSLSK